MTANGLLENKIAVVVGGGQTPGETIGNGRATAIQFAREGARVLVGDRDVGSAEETVAMILDEGGEAASAEIDVTVEESVASFMAAAVDRWGRIDVLHNNVGVGLAGADAGVEEISADVFDQLVRINLRGMVLTAKHVLPGMRERGSGVIINISSMAAWKPYPFVGYKTTKAGVIALTEQLAQANARYGIRANVILPGLMNTPMAVEPRVSQTMTREEVIADRDRRVPLGRKMGTAWDVAHAAAFLASDRARFITGVALPVDGGASVS
ncbi:MAG TPA: SDR family NAD(P)-dependent oxidoreductase [Pseudomonadales bacterium]|jgi:NAD(P)-dependent dehydrogenase (short-subunit alcohol dehydrogenase family)